MALAGADTRPSRLIKHITEIEIAKEKRGKAFKLRYRVPSDPDRRMLGEDGVEVPAHVIRVDKTGFAQIEYEDGTGHNVEILWV